MGEVLIGFSKLKTFDRWKASAQGNEVASVLFSERSFVGNVMVLFIVCIKVSPNMLQPIARF